MYVKVVRLWGWWESARFRQRDENVAGCGSELRCRIWDDKFEVNGDLRERKLERIAKKKEVIVEWWWWGVGIRDGEALVQERGETQSDGSRIMRTGAEISRDYERQ